MRSLSRTSSISSMRPLNVATLLSTPRARSRIDSICSALARSLADSCERTRTSRSCRRRSTSSYFLRSSRRQLHVRVVDADRHLGVVEILAHAIRRVALALDLGHHAVDLGLRVALLRRRDRRLDRVLVILLRRHRRGAHAVELGVQLGDALVELVELRARALLALLNRLLRHRQRAQLLLQRVTLLLEPLELRLGPADVADEPRHLARQRLLDHARSRSTPRSTWRAPPPARGRR